MPDHERNLIGITRRYASRARALEEVATERDEEIRAALVDGVPRRRIVEITGLSSARVDQIRHEGNGRSGTTLAHIRKAAARA